MLRQLIESPPETIDSALPAAWQAPLDTNIARLCKRLDMLAMQTSRQAQQDPALDQATLAQMFDYGLFSLTVPAEYGGLGACVRDFVAAMESVGRMGPAYAMTAVPHLCISVKSVASLCGASQARAILGAIRAQHRLLAFAITEDNGSDVAAVKTRLTRSPDGSLRLNGRKQWITNLARASHVVVVALCPELHPAPGATILVLLAMDQSGVSFSKPLDKLCANGSDTSELYFDDVEVEAHQLLGQPGRGLSLFNDMVLSGRLGAAAAAVGMTRQALQVARDDAVLTAAHGAAIGATLDVLSAALTLSAALGDAGHPEFPMVTALSKHMCTRQAQALVGDIAHGYACAGKVAPPAVTRALNAMGLFRLLKGPGEIIALHALAAWAPRINRVPVMTWPHMVRVALQRVVSGFSGLNAAGGMSANPLSAILLSDMTGAWWLLFAAVMAVRSGNAAIHPGHQRLALAWAWHNFSISARRLAASPNTLGIEHVNVLYKALRQANLIHDARAMTWAGQPC
jgi:acyl-CoA dehydrogenase